MTETANPAENGLPTVAKIALDNEMATGARVFATLDKIHADARWVFFQTAAVGAVAGIAIYQTVEQIFDDVTSKAITMGASGLIVLIMLGVLIMGLRSRKAKTDAHGQFEQALRNSNKARLTISATLALCAERLGDNFPTQDDIDARVAEVNKQEAADASH